MTNKNKKGNGGGSVGPSSGATKLSKQRSQDSHDYNSFKTVLFYCSLIVFCPVLTFFILKGFVLESYFSMSDMKVNIFSAVGAVVALHIALGLYIYRAYFGGSSTKSGGEEKLD